MHNSCNLRNLALRLCLCKALMAQLQDVALLACGQLQPVCLQATRHPKLCVSENIQLSCQLISINFMSFHAIFSYFQMTRFFDVWVCLGLTSVQRDKDESTIWCILIPHNLQVPTFLCHHAVQRSMKVTASWKHFESCAVLPRSVAVAWPCS